MKIVRTSDYREMSKKAANLIAAQIIQKPDSVLGLATGSSPIGTYEELIRKCENGDVDFSEITTVNLDEYKGLSKNNPQSYYYFMNDNLFNHVNIDKIRTHFPDEEVEKYEQLIQNIGGIDLQLLGLGHNGHIGFNEPSDIFEKRTHIVQLQERTIEANKRFFESIDDVPREAYTMGIGTIMAARKILLVVSGADKAEIVKKAFTGPITPQIPASVLQMHSDVTVICDADAYKLLEK